MPHDGVIDSECQKHSGFHIGRGDNSMDNSTSDSQSLASRVERLEKQNLFLKRAGLALLVLPAALMFMGQSRPTRTIEAQNFVLRDSSGNKRAELSMGVDAAGLQFFDSKGHVTSTLTESSIVLAGPSGGGLISLNAANASNGDTTIYLRDSDGFSASLGVTDTVIAGTGQKRKTSAASLTLFGSDKDGNKVLWSAP
jgi:hypothetical protein